MTTHTCPNAQMKPKHRSKHAITRTYICTPTQVYTYTYIRAHTNTHSHTPSCICTRSCFHTRKYTGTYTRGNGLICTSTRSLRHETHKCARAHNTHTHTHTQTETRHTYIVFLHTPVRMRTLTSAPSLVHAHIHAQARTNTNTHIKIYACVYIIQTNGRNDNIRIQINTYIRTRTYTTYYSSWTVIAGLGNPCLVCTMFMLLCSNVFLLYGVTY